MKIYRKFIENFTVGSLFKVHHPQSTNCGLGYNCKTCVFTCVLISVLTSVYPGVLISVLTSVLTSMFTCVLICVFISVNTGACINYQQLVSFKVIFTDYFTDILSLTCHKVSNRPVIAFKF